MAETYLRISKNCYLRIAATAIRDRMTEEANQLHRARLLAASQPHTAAWLQAVPVPKLGLHLDEESVRVAVALRLGAPICEDHACRLCGRKVDSLGHHGLSCLKSAGRLPRHAHLNEVVRRGLASAGIPAILEPVGLDRGDGKRPDGLTLFPYSAGMCLIWDATCTDTFADSAVIQAALEPGAVASAAEARKIKRYASLSSRYKFSPIAVETSGVLGPVTTTFIKELGRLITARTGDRRETEWLLQRLSIAVVRGNAASVLATAATARTATTKYQPRERVEDGGSRRQPLQQRHPSPPREREDKRSPRQSVSDHPQPPDVKHVLLSRSAEPPSPGHTGGCDQGKREIPLHNTEQPLPGAGSRRLPGDIGNPDDAQSTISQQRRLPPLSGESSEAQQKLVPPTYPRSALPSEAPPAPSPSSSFRRSQSESSSEIRGRSRSEGSSATGGRPDCSSETGGRFRAEGYSETEITGRSRQGGSGETSGGGNPTVRPLGLTGLRNIGNTCFMNSVLQCLSNTRALHDYILREEYTPDINTSISVMKGALIKPFAALMRDLWKRSEETNRVLTTAPLMSQIQRFAPRFIGHQQQDAQEFLRYLLEGLHEDVNRVTSRPKSTTTDINDSFTTSQRSTESWKRFLSMENSKFVDLFVGQLKSMLLCTVCGHASVAFDPFWDLSLPLPTRTGQLGLQNCFNLFTKEEVLDGNEKPTCVKCQKRQKCTRSLSIQRFPRILVVHLKRFSTHERLHGKLNTTVNFSATGLDLSPYSAGQKRCRYDLYGVTNHSGSLFSGHYTACCKHPYTAEWYEFNDSRVHPVSLRNLKSSEAYMLFFELADSLPA